MKMTRELHHNECIAHMPEYVSGTLRHTDAAAVAAHLEQCQRCREYLQIGRSLRRHFSRQQKVLANLQTVEREQENFDQLWQRIEAEPEQKRAASLNDEAESHTTRRRRFPCNPTRRPWRSLATIASAVLAAIMATQEPPPLHRPEFMSTPHTQVTSTRNACNHLRVHFIDNLQRADLQRLLGAVNAHVIKGPGQGGEYTLSAQRPNKTLYELQLHPAVVQAESNGCQS